MNTASTSGRDSLLSVYDSRYQAIYAGSETIWDGRTRFLVRDDFRTGDEVIIDCGMEGVGMNYFCGFKTERLGSTRAHP